MALLLLCAPDGRRVQSELLCQLVASWDGTGDGGSSCYDRIEMSRSYLHEELWETSMGAEPGSAAGVGFDEALGRAHTGCARNPGRCDPEMAQIIASLVEGVR